MAGKQKGKEDERFLWPEMLRVIRELEPRWVFGENVFGIINIAADEICADLERAGYEVGIFDYEAAAVGAPHRRERIAFVARRRDGVLENSSCCGCGKQKVLPEQSRGAEFVWSGEVVADADKSRVQGWAKTGNACGMWANTEQHIGRCDNGDRWRPTEPGLGLLADGISAWLGECRLNPWDVEPDIPRVAKGILHRVDQLKCYGNAVVPQWAYPIFKAIADIEREG